MLLNLLKNEQYEELYSLSFSRTNKENYERNLDVLLNEFSSIIKDNIQLLKGKKKLTYKRDLFKFINLLTLLIHNLNKFCLKKRKNLNKLNNLTRIQVLKSIYSCIKVENFLTNLLVDPWIIMLNDKIDIKYYTSVDLISVLKEVVPSNILDEINLKISDEINKFLSSFVLDTKLDFISQFVNICEKVTFIGTINKSHVETIYKQIKTESTVFPFYSFLASDSLELIIAFLKYVRLLEEKKFLEIVCFFIKDFKDFLKEVIRKNNKNSIGIVMICKELQNTFFSQNFREILNLINNEEYSFKTVLKQLKKSNGISFETHFPESIHHSILSNNKELIEYVLIYIDVIDDFSLFENRYIDLLIERAFNLKSFNKELETEIINTIVENTKNIFLHSFKLQTVISTLKIVQNKNLCLLGFPIHCYTPINLGCKPIVHNFLKSLIEKDFSSFPKNTKLITHMGSLTFNYKNIEVTCNPLQFSILLFLKNGALKEEEVLKKMEITDNLFDFLVVSLIENDLLLRRNKLILLNKDFKKDSRDVSIDCNLNEFIINNSEKIKISIEYTNKLIDAFVVQIMKKQKECDRIILIQNVYNMI